MWQSTLWFCFWKIIYIQILQSINAEELPSDRTIDSDSNEDEDKKIEPVKQSVETIVDTVEVISL